MTQVTLPIPVFRFALRIELVRVAFRPTNRVARRSRQVELREALRSELSPHLLRDVGLDDSRLA
jgi:hypothetical protein